MTWIQQPDIDGLLKVLVMYPSPGLKYFCLYQSDLKNVGLTFRELGAVQSTGNTGQSQYATAMAKQDLIVKSGANFQLTKFGESYFAKASTYLDIDAQDAINELDEFVFRHLLDLVVRAKDIKEKSPEEFFAKRLRNAQRFLSVVPDDDLQEILSDKDILFFLQGTNLEEVEAKRFFQLGSREDRKAFIELWDKFRYTVAAKDANAPTSEPERSMYQYFSQVRSAATKGTRILQESASPRIESFLRAYTKLAGELGNDFPVIDAKYKVKRQTSRATAIKDLPASKGDMNASLQLIMTGCPGSGKSKELETLVASGDVHSIRTIFHPETSYFDFVGSFKPSPVYEITDAKFQDSARRAFNLGRPAIDYRFVPGPMVHALELARCNPNTRIALIIEEINRANCAAVFGDFLQLLDRRDDGTSEYPIEPNPDLGAYLIRQGFNLSEGLILPSNLYIWATMNSADQGVFPMDSAFRRRWEFKYRGFSTPCAYGKDKVIYGGAEHDWDDFRSKINEALIGVSGIHEDKLIGPYFLKKEELQDSGKILYKLFHYLWEDVVRHQQRSVFAVKSLDELDRVWNDGKGSPLSFVI